MKKISDFRKQSLRIFLLFVFPVLFSAFLVGCATVDRQQDLELERVENEGLEVASSLRFEDVPIPSAFRLKSGDSFVFQNDKTRMGLLRYIGKPEVTEIIKFYKEQMSLYNWNLLSIVEHNKVVLNFEKQGESCAITLEPLTTRTIITISLVPITRESKPNSSE
ncbi:MAG: hypothetical protein KAS87_02215 [Candidatus Omnitrophica bacterium]|nr:hypothetical protein [Candidatus Omnitrophota bacterium]